MYSVKKKNDLYKIKILLSINYQCNCLTISNRNLGNNFLVAFQGNTKLIKRKYIIIHIFLIYVYSERIPFYYLLIFRKDCYII